MINTSNLKKGEKENYLFIPVTAWLEIRWLLEKAGIINDFKYYDWRAVKNRQVSAIKSLTDEDKKAELDKYYSGTEEWNDGDKEDFENFAIDLSAVIVFKYDKDGVFEMLKETLIGEGDPDYRKHWDEESAFANENIPDIEGIPVIAGE